MQTFAQMEILKMKVESKFITLNNGWKVIHDENNVGKKNKWYLGIPKENSVEATVPGYVHQFIPECRGIAWYQLDFENTLKSNDDDLFILRFAMAEWHVEAWLNGVEIGTHDGCEDEFEFDVTSQIKNDNNRLVIRVSKPYTQPVDGYEFMQIPHRNEIPVGLRPGQCYNAFGLSGQIDLLVVPKLYIKDIFLFANTKTGNIEANYTIYNAYSTSIEGEITTECSVKRSGEYVNGVTKTYTFLKGDNALKNEVKIENFLWWDIDDPNLYLVNSILTSKTTCHKQLKRCGFRTFEVNEENGYFYLNGRRIFLRSSHTGNCMPESFHHVTKKKELLRRDFSMAKAVGFNMVRFISGVALPEQLDYCDELGLMVYEETVAGWNLCDGPNAEERLRHDIFSMIKRDRSHPCVTIFGFLNETTTLPPFGNCYMYARNALTDARILDPTRLFLYNSGRFDGKAVSGEKYDSWCGSFSNPNKTVWQELWNEDTSIPHFYEEKRLKDGLPQAYKPEGDVHDYFMYPISKLRENQLRTLGHYTNKPVFVSETGIGSMFNAIWLERKFEEMHASPDAPDVKITKQMAADFIDGLKKFGFDKEYPFPIDILRESEKQHNLARTAIFNILRSNPLCNGVSLTGLLDHSVCGEGFFTFMREFKSGIADTLQNGFAPTKWCLFVSDKHTYRNRPFVVEAVLAMEDTLEVGDYPVSLKITNKDMQTVWGKDVMLHVNEEDLKYFSIPVFNQEISLDVPTGEYELRAELLKGGAATDGKLTLYITDDKDIKAEVKKIVGVSLSENVTKMLKSKGVEILPLDKAYENAVILVGEIPENERDEVWKKLNSMIQLGSRIFVASRYSFVKDKDWSYYMPLPQNEKPRNASYSRETSDWLYHKEYLLKRNHPYFKGLPTGMMNPDYFNYVISSHAFIYDYCERVPDETQAMATSLGLPWGLEDSNAMKADGVEIGTYNIGKGAMTICAFNLLENVSLNPTADIMLLNVLNEESKKL